MVLLAAADAFSRGEASAEQIPAASAFGNQAVLGLVENGSSDEGFSRKTVLNTDNVPGFSDSVPVNDGSAGESFQPASPPVFSSEAAGTSGGLSEN